MNTSNPLSGLTILASQLQQDCIKVSALKQSHITQIQEAAYIDWNTTCLLIPINSKYKTLVIDQKRGAYKVKESTITLIDKYFFDHEPYWPKLQKSLSSFQGTKEYHPRIFHNNSFIPTKRYDNLTAPAWISIKFLERPMPFNNHTKLYFKEISVGFLLPISIEFLRARVQNCDQLNQTITEIKHNFLSAFEESQFRFFRQEEITGNFVQYFIAENIRDFLKYSGIELPEECINDYLRK